VIIDFRNKFQSKGSLVDPHVIANLHAFPKSIVSQLWSWVGCYQHSSTSHCFPKNIVSFTNSIANLCGWNDRSRHVACGMWTQ